MGTNNKNTSDNKKSNEQKFYESVMQKIGALILHTVGATVFVLITILLGVECAKSGGHWTLLLSLIVCIAVTIVCIGAVIVDTCNMLFFVDKIHVGNRKY